jgi:hypothetical protein
MSNLIQEVEKNIYEGKVSNTELVQLIELVGAYLNIQTIPQYAQQNGLSYNGVKKCRTVQKILNVKFVIDNE